MTRTWQWMQGEQVLLCLQAEQNLLYSIQKKSAACCVFFKHPFYCVCNTEHMRHCIV
jgi:hypothetical protein